MTTLNKIVDTDKADVALYDKVNAMAQALNDGKAEDSVVVKTVNGKTPDNSGDVTVSSGGILPGMIIQTLATSSYVPEGCVPCDGGEYTKALYPDFYTDWLLPTTVNLYAWKNDDSAKDFVYTKSATPSAGDALFDEDGNALDDTILSVSGNTITTSAGRNYTRDSSFDKSISQALLKTCTYSEYASALANNGFCDKIALDTSTEKFKVPKLNNVLYQNIDGALAVRGNGKTLGLTNGTQNIGLSYSGAAAYGLWASPTLYGKNVGTSSLGASDPKLAVTVGVTTDESNSGVVAVNKANAEVRYFIVLATTSINQSQMDWNAYNTALAGRATIDLTNISPAGKATAVGWCVPDYTAGVAISGITAANTSFTVPKDGILHIVMNAVSGLSVTYVDDMEACALANASGYSGFAVSFMPISRGTHTFRCDIPNRVKSITFYPYKGS